MYYLQEELLKNIQTYLFIQVVIAPLSTQKPTNQRSPFF